MAKRILLIEDDLDIQRIYTEKLKNDGYELDVQIDVAHALDALSKTRPDLILLDIMLPGKMNGFDMLKHIKADTAYKDIPVIVITNIDTEREEALRVGASDYLIKANTELSELSARIKELI